MHPIAVFLLLALFAPACLRSELPAGGVLIEPSDLGASDTGDERFGMISTLVGRFGEACPPDAAVYVTVSPALFEQGYWGTTQWDSDLSAYVITLDARLPSSVMAGVLAHEWAHTIAFDAAHENDHGPTWGVAFAATYRVLEAWRMEGGPTDE